MTRLRIGIDLGGTKIEGVLLDDHGQEILRHRLLTPPNDYGATLKSIGLLVAHLEKSVGAKGLRVGMGIPGSLADNSGLVRNANSTCLNGQALGRDIIRLLGRNVRISNDANCLALSETRDGVAKGANVVFAVILGTGTGGGLVVNGRLIVGAHGLGGEFGHTPLAHQGADMPPCYCGRTGCNETYLSGPGIVRDYARAGGPPVTQVQDIAGRAAKGENLASQVLVRHKMRLGQALGAVVNLIDPDMIVLAGGVSNLPGLAADLPDVIAPHLFATGQEKIRVTVQKARWGDSSGVRGAAQLWGTNE